MIISGLRISCAMTVDRRPSDDSRSRCAVSRWKRAIESVSVLNVVASSRASSSCQRPSAGSAIFRVRSPVAAISRIVAVIAASGRVTVRATPKLSSVASRTASTAVAPSTVWSARRNRSRSVRDRRISAVGARLSLPEGPSPRQRDELVAIDARLRRDAGRPQQLTRAWARCFRAALPPALRRPRQRRCRCP